MWEMLLANLILLQTARRDANANATIKQTLSHINERVLHSGVLEDRKIKHPAAITRNVFVKQFYKTKATRSCNRFYSSKVKLTKKWSKLVIRKTWQCITEDSVHKTAAAWHWLQLYVSTSLSTKGISIGSALSSALAQAQLLLCGPDGHVWASLGHAVWGFLAWPVQAHEGAGSDADDMKLYIFQVP